jgi:4-amino-4-deoxy-L-arabinose transferase-like glycosyltransferase
VARLVPALLLALLTALPRLPLIDDPVDVKPDGCEYLGIGRHIAREGRWVSSIKWHFFNDAPPIHPAIADRPPLYPLVTSVVWRFAEEPIRSARLANIALASLDTVLAYLLLARLIPLPAALGAAALLALYPAWMRDSVQPLTEPLFMAFWLGALLLFYSRGGESLSGRRAALLGIASGLAYLTRPSGLLLPVFFSLALLPPLAVRPAPRALLPLWSGFVLAWAPYGAAVALETGSPFTSILSYNFSIRHIYEGTLYGFERSFPKPLAFVAARPVEIVTLVGQQTWVLLAALGRSLRFLLPLALFLRTKDLRRDRELWLLAALNFSFHAVAWTVWGAGRYLLPTYLLVAALLLAAPLARSMEAEARVWRWTPLAAAGAAWLGALLACVAGDVRLHREKGLPDSGVRMGWAYREAAQWLEREPGGASDAVASNQPWILNLLSGRPARMAPRFRDVEQARRFSRRFPVRWLIYFAEEPEDFVVLERIAPRRGDRRALAAPLRDEWELVRAVERDVPASVAAPARRSRRTSTLQGGRWNDRTALLMLRRR